jgi:D-threo-aldose 1-dehydrogenase
MGGVPLGNEFEVVTDEDAYATIEAAWNAGVRYYDMAPWYGLGLAERRYGNFLLNKERSEYVLSTKVGRITLPCRRRSPPSSGRISKRRI